MNKKFIVFLFSFLIYFVGIILGIFFSLSVPLADNTTINPITSSSFLFAISLFKVNIIVDLIIVSGLFIFGLPTIILLIINGFSLGYAITVSYLMHNSIIKICIAILPHGIFEIAGLIFAGAVGLNGFKIYFRENKNWKQLSIYLCISIILIFIAALVEGLITPLLLKFLINKGEV